MKYIIESTPNILNINYEIIESIEDKIKNSDSITEEETNYLLDYICYETRCKLTNDLENDSFEFKCDLAQSIICYYLDELGIKYNACMTQKAITNDIVGHSFVISELNNKLYLIDPTYRQFFKEEDNQENNYLEIQNMIVKTPNPGYFIKEEDKKHIIPFLKSGYIVLDENTARIYGDSFYNTKTGYTDKNYKSINGNIYINSFLKGNETLSKSREELSNDNLLINNNKRHI